MSSHNPPKQLWKHSSPQSTRVHAFRKAIEQKYHVSLPEYHHLHRWSIDNVDLFWQEVWRFTGIVSSAPFHRAVEDESTMYPRPAFFPGAKLNFAENLLFPQKLVEPDAVAVIAATEVSREKVSWKELRERVRRCAQAMQARGLLAGDRVAGFVANHTNTLVVMLAATSLGAVWSGVSPDTGAHAVLERLRQIEPAMLVADSAVLYNGKTHDVLAKVQEVIIELPSLHTLVIFDNFASPGLTVADLRGSSVEALSYESFLDLADCTEDFHFAQLPPDHPIYILYSSGTTGKPKCIVHGAIGTLIQHKKEHEIQCDLGVGDRLFYFTTCTWMMWHWLVSGLASGVTIVLYDGSPFRPLDATGQGELAMARLIDELDISHFGTSAKYLSMLEQKDVAAKETLALSRLRAIYSTGSPLAPSTFEYVYRAFGPDLNLGSITGGTDIVSLFGAPSQISPVYSGEIQALGLGMAVRIWNADGKDISESGEAGDLVCVRPFPCQPVMFWGADGEETYRASYFDVFPGVWRHGDFARIDPETGGMVMLGRSDGVLKPAGVRFGSAEVYNVLLKHFAAEVVDALCIGRRREQDVDETVVLFVKLADGHRLDDGLIKKIRDAIRSELSPRHVPAVVDECPEIPVTMNGKKVEVAVKQILCGLNIKISASVANADCLEWYRQWARSHA